MAEDEKVSTPRKRAARKKPAVTSKSTNEPNVEMETGTEVEDVVVGREVMTTTSTEATVVDEDNDNETNPAPEPMWSIDDRNRAQLGELIVHASTRDVVIVLDGESAARVMSVFAGTGQRRRLQDLMAAGQSDMANMWSSIDLAQVIGISWIPHLPTRADRVMTVDPPVPDVLTG